MAKDVLGKLREMGRGLAPKFPPIPLYLEGIGAVGHLEHRRGLYINSALKSQVMAIAKAEEQAEIAAREISAGRLGASDLLPVIALGSDRRDAIHAIKSMRGAVATWNDFIDQQLTGKSSEIAILKTIGGTIQQWQHMGRLGGNPIAFTYGSIPGPAAYDGLTTGAVPFGMSLGGSENLYLTNFGVSTAHQILLVVDLLHAATGIDGSIVTSQNVSTTAHPRWTGGKGILVAYEFMSGSGAAGTATISYVDQDGATQTTPAFTTPIFSTAFMVGGSGGGTGVPYIQLASTSYGIKSVAQWTYSVTNTTTTLAALVYKPLITIACYNTLTFQEKAMPLRLGRLVPLTETAGGSKACLSFIGWTPNSQPSTILSALAEVTWG